MLAVRRDDCIAVLLMVVAFAIMINLPLSLEKNSDWVRHIEMSSSNELNGYPNIYWFFPWSLTFWAALFLCFLMPSALSLIARKFNGSVLLTTLCYFLSLVPFWMFAMGLLKQIVVSLVILGALCAFLTLKSKWKHAIPLAIIPVVLYFEPASRLMGALHFLHFPLTISLWFAWVVVMELYLIRKSKYWSLVALGYMVGLFETRIMAEVAILAIPLVCSSLASYKMIKVFPVSPVSNVHADNSEDKSSQAKPVKD